MKVNNPKFIVAAVHEDQYPNHDRKEIAMAGRSNVGKSSLINKMINRKKLAKTSSQPGRTQTINFYDIDDKFYFVDLPGYGFAKVPLEVKAQWGEMIEHYLFNRPNLSGIIQLVDCRHQPSKDDQMMYDWLRQMDTPTLVVATKADKISRNQQQKQRKVIFETLGMPKDQPFTFFSAETGDGKDVVWAFIREYV